MFDFLFDPNSPALWLFILIIISGAIAVIIRPFSSYIKFVYPNAKFEAMGSPYISLHTLQNLMEASSLEDLIEQINTDKDYEISGNDAVEVQQSLDDQLFLIINQMKKDSSKKMVSFYQTYLEKKDAYVVKQVLHQLHNKQRISIEYFDQHNLNKSTKKLLAQLSESDELNIHDLKEFGLTEEDIKTILSEETLPLQIDAIVDKYYLHNLEQVKVPYKCKEGKNRYINRYKDILSIQLLLRAKHMNYHQKLCKLMFIEEGYEISKWKFFELCKSENISQLIDGLDGTAYFQTLKQTLERSDKGKNIQLLTTALDMLFLHLVKEISQQHYTTIGPTLRFLVSKEAEIKNLKIIAKGVIEQFSKEQITPLCITEVET